MQSCSHHHREGQVAWATVEVGGVVCILIHVLKKVNVPSHEGGRR